MEFLTHEIAYAYRDRAKVLPDNGMQDAGERRALRMELQERCGITELEAVNILNGFYVNDYCVKYLAIARAMEGEDDIPRGHRAKYVQRRKKEERKRIYE